MGASIANGVNLWYDYANNAPMFSWRSNNKMMEGNMQKKFFGVFVLILSFTLCTTAYALEDDFSVEIEPVNYSIEAVEGSSPSYEITERTSSYFSLNEVIGAKITLTVPDAYYTDAAMAERSLTIELDELEFVDFIPLTATAQGAISTSVDEDRDERSFRIIRTNNSMLPYVQRGGTYEFLVMAQVLKSDASIDVSITHDYSEELGILYDFTPDGANTAYTIARGETDLGMVKSKEEQYATALAGGEDIYYIGESSGVYYLAGMEAVGAFSDRATIPTVGVMIQDAWEENYRIHPDTSAPEMTMVESSEMMGKYDIIHDVVRVAADENMNLFTLRNYGNFDAFSKIAYSLGYPSSWEKTLEIPRAGETFDEAWPLLYTPTEDDGEIAEYHVTTGITANSYVGNSAARIYIGRRDICEKMTIALDGQSLGIASESDANHDYVGIEYTVNVAGDEVTFVQEEMEYTAVMWTKQVRQNLPSAFAYAQASHYIRIFEDETLANRYSVNPDTIIDSSHPLYAKYLDFYNQVCDDFGFDITVEGELTDDFFVDEYNFKGDTLLIQAS